jgi:hypothetical protein
VFYSYRKRPVALYPKRRRPFGILVHKVIRVNDQLAKAACIGWESCSSALRLQSRFFQQKSGYLYGGQATRGSGIADDNRRRSIPVHALRKF